MPVFIEDPMSFKVEEFLNAFAAANGHFFFILNPDKFNCGPAIGAELQNIPVIGLCTKPRTKAHQLGFVTSSAKEAKVDEDAIYAAEALLLLDVNPKDLPSGSKGINWALQVREEKMIDTFLPIAEALSKEFLVDIYITPATSTDEDIDHLPARPVDQRYPVGPQFNPIIIRTVK